MDALRLTEFNNLIAAINRMNSRAPTPTVDYVLISGCNLIKKDALSLYDLSKFDYLIVLGQYVWSNGNYANTSAILLGFFNKDLELIESIPVNDNIRISGIEFECYKGSFYNEFKPIFICQKTNGETVELKLEESGKGWSKDFQTLYKQVIELDK